VLVPKLSRRGFVRWVGRHHASGRPLAARPSKGFGEGLLRPMWPLISPRLGARLQPWGCGKIRARSQHPTPPRPPFPFHVSALQVLAGGNLPAG